MTALSPSPRIVETPQPRRGHTWLGAVLILAGGVMLLSQVGVLASPWPAIPAFLLVLVGGAVVVEGLRGTWHGTLVALGVALTLITALSTTASNSWHMTAGGFGERTYAPLQVADLDDAYELGAGSLTLDLRRLALPPGTTDLSVDVGMGEVTVRVPDGVAVDVRADSGTGEVQIFGSDEGGLGVNRTYVTPGYEDADRKLDLDLSVGMGTIEVTR